MNIGPIIWSSLFEASVIKMGCRDLQGSPTHSREIRWRSASRRRWWMIVGMVLMTQDILLPDEMVEIFEIMDIG